MRKSQKILKAQNAFTIVELLVVIVVIGILAAITIVSYSGITKRANIASIQAELSGASKKLAMYYAQNGSYPANLDSDGCPTTPIADASNCIKFGNSIVYKYSYRTTSSYNLVSSRGDIIYKITENTAPTEVLLNPTDWLIIGSQTWAKSNLNVGTRIAGTTNQTSTVSAIEKYCYVDNETNCTNNGGLYQWDEAMWYATNEGAQGICPDGSHIPSDSDWKVLEVALNMTQLQADSTGWRGTDQGTRLKPSGSSGLNMPLGGYRSIDGSFFNLGTYSFIWSSSQADGDAWDRFLNSGNVAVNRGVNNKIQGFSVRCLKN